MECLYCTFFHYQEEVFDHIREVHGEKKYFLAATNGLVVSNQCRKCGLGGAKRAHFGPVNNEQCVLVKFKLRKEKIKPILPPVRYFKSETSTPCQVGRDETKMRAVFVTLNQLKLEGKFEFVYFNLCTV